MILSLIHIYTIINDVSARTLQTQHNQWYFGKSLDGFFPMGPCITTVEDIPYPPKLSIQSRVNGELRQDSNTGLLIFGIDHIVSELSKGCLLYTSPCLRLAMFVIPNVLALVQVILSCMYPLSQEKMEEVNTELEMRHSNPNHVPVDVQL